MNVKEYIQSGIVEACVLGLATDAERTEFERVCAAHPEVAEARDAFERSLEEALLNDAAAGEPPSAQLKARILGAIAPPAQNAAQLPQAEPAPVRRLNAWKLLAAACFLGLLAVGYWGYRNQEKYEAALAKGAEAEKALAQKEGDMAAMQQQADVATSAGVARVVMKGQPAAPQATATVYWDTTGTKDVYLKINNLPQPAGDRQYQLWALLDGKPIDLGLLQATQRPLLVKMKNVQKAQAFAISLERTGGSTKTTPEGVKVPEGEIYVLGNL